MRSTGRIDFSLAEEQPDESAARSAVRPAAVSLRTLEARGKLALQEFHRQVAKSAWLAQQSLALVTRFSPNEEDGADGASALFTFRHLLAREPVKAMAAVEEASGLARSVAHDLNNLLGVINAYSELLIKSASDERQLKDLKEIRDAASRAGELSRQLSTGARVRAWHPRAIDLAEIVSDMAGMLERVVGPRISVTSRTDSRLGLVLADRGQLDQALLNLVVNARDAMPNGGVLTIEAAACEGAEPHVVLRVSDTGIGMDEFTQAHIFDPLFTTKGPDKGTGLGLPAVKAIVEDHGGFVRVASEVGKGTTVNLYFPCIEPVAATAEPH